MNMATKNNVFEEKVKEYWKANKERKGAILDAVCEVSGLTRKGAIKRFRRMQITPKWRTKRSGRPIVYGTDVRAALREVWDAANEPCGELLHPVIREYVRCLTRDRLWKHGQEATARLLVMGKRTVRRVVETFDRSRRTAKALAGTKPSHLKNIIPVFKGPWSVCDPGEGQIDMVAHCGHTLLGNFIRTVCYTDAATYWVIPRAQWNLGQVATKESVEAIQTRLPVSLRHVHPDTGSEFINWLLKDWCEEERIRLTRSEPGKKNDNMYVEERNGHVVRKYLGYTRFDCPQLVPLLNELYDVLVLYLNHFQAVRRTLAKERIGAKYRRVYEREAQTSYERMCMHPRVPAQVKERLRAEHETLNPLLLKRKIDTLRADITKKQRDHGHGNCDCGRF